jgi:hypothetical protein
MGLLRALIFLVQRYEPLGHHAEGVGVVVLVALVLVYMRSPGFEELA